MEELLNRAGTTDYRHGSGSEVADRGEGRYGDTGTGLPVPRRKCQMITIFGYCKGARWTSCWAFTVPRSSCVWLATEREAAACARTSSPPATGHIIGCIEHWASDTSRRLAVPRNVVLPRPKYKEYPLPLMRQQTLVITTLFLPPTFHHLQTSSLVYLPP